MCGIAGLLNLTQDRVLSSELLCKMLGMLRHRGPDSFGCYIDRRAQLGNARLSIIDHSGGQQPIHNEDEKLWLVFNGEIYNYVELREELVARGHRFYTHSDTEVIVHLYEDIGPRCLDALNGQFAIAIWDRGNRELFLARDRIGVRPLFYAESGGVLRFASEVKALLVDPRLPRQLDPAAIDQVFTFWSPIAPRTPFRGIQQLPPGHYLLARDGRIATNRYWRLRFAADTGACQSKTESYAEQLRDLFIDATRLRLRADVPVGAYLSGGLDSSITAAVIKKYTGNHLRTFSISFTDQTYDETAYQQAVSKHLGTEHQQIQCTAEDIARVFPDVVWHAETPLLRTAPAPLYLLSMLVHQAGFKVVLTGEGADEFFGGYDIFKEAMVRRFWARHPDSRSRPLLLQKIYGFIPDLKRGFQPYLEAFFRPGLADYDNPLFSHLIRWQNTAKLKHFFSDDLKAELANYSADAELDTMLDADLAEWHPLAKAQYLEIVTFLSEYLLSSQGDRMAMANSVEGRFPYLDHRLIEFCNQLPPRLKLCGLNEKYLLKQAFADLIPAEITRRVKQPYRAPISSAFFAGMPEQYVEELLSPGELVARGYFAPAAVSRLVQKCRAGAPSEWDNMALAGVLSVQLLDKSFRDDFHERCDGVAATPNLLVVADGETLRTYGREELCPAD